MKIDFHTILGKKYKKPSARKTNETGNKAETKEEVDTEKECEDLVINEKPIKPNELKLVLDNMLHGLGKELRRCGVDTVMIDNNQEHSDIARVRIIRESNS